jgi:ornithine cyclodeaminase
MRVYHRAEIEKAVDPAAAIDAIADGFAAFSKGNVIVPPVGHLEFKNPTGEMHIKYGYRLDDDVFVVKIATGFYENPAHGLSSSSGLLLVWSARTGFPQALLLDEGYLTDLRTAAAGAVAAKYLAPKNLRAIGIVGSGIQAHLQLDLLRHVTQCRRAVIWARDPAKARSFKVDGFSIEVADSVAALCGQCNLIVTTTPSREPLIAAGDVRPGTHITAVGADSPGKQELDASLFAKAVVLAVDSRAQCFDHGDSVHALNSHLVEPSRFVELGEIIAGTARGRTSEEQITIADLTGLAVQDIEIAKLALRSLE